MGCFLKGCLAVIVSILLVICAGWYVVFHTSLPAKGVLSLLELDPKLEIKGVSGSISKGFGIRSIRYRHDDTKTSHIDDIGFSYKKSLKAFVIEDFHVKSAYLYLDLSKKSSDEEETDIKAEGERKKPSSGTPFNKDFIIERITINDITIDDPKTGKKILLEKINSDGVMLGHGQLQLGNLLIASRNLNIRMVPMDAAGDYGTGSRLDITAEINSAFHAYINKDIEFTGIFDLNANPPTFFKFDGFNGKVKIDADLYEDSVHISLTDFTPFEYFNDDRLLPLSNIHFKAKNQLKNSDKIGIEILSGGFVFGNTPFALEKGYMDLIQKPENWVVKARSVAANTSYTISFICNHGKDSVRFESVPPMGQRDIFSRLVFQKAYNDLEDDEKSQITTYMDFYLNPDKRTEKKI